MFFLFLFFDLGFLFLKIIGQLFGRLSLTLHLSHASYDLGVGHTVILVRQEATGMCCHYVAIGLGMLTLIILAERIGGRGRVAGPLAAVHLIFTMEKELWGKAFPSSVSEGGVHRDLEMPLG